MSDTEHYKIGIVSRSGSVFTAGVDVQKNRLELEIVAWGPNHKKAGR